MWFGGDGGGSIRCVLLVYYKIFEFAHSIFLGAHAVATDCFWIVPNAARNVRNNEVTLSVNGGAVEAKDLFW